jgi:hypothetical protein
MLNVVMLNVVMLNVLILYVVILNILMLNVVMLNIIMLSVVEQGQHTGLKTRFNPSYHHCHKEEMKWGKEKKFSSIWKSKHTFKICF